MCVRLSESAVEEKAVKTIAKENGLDNTRYYVDNGYTGTNFNRTGFKKMIEVTDPGYVSTVIVKDLSSLVRRYDTVGYYTDTFFPDCDICFIAINDNVDSDEEDNEIAPFKNIKGTLARMPLLISYQRKHRRAFVTTAIWVYENKKKCLVDPEAAQIVCDILKWR